MSIIGDCLFNSFDERTKMIPFLAFEADVCSYRIQQP